MVGEKFEKLKKIQNCWIKIFKSKIVQTKNVKIVPKSSRFTIFLLSKLNFAQGSITDIVSMHFMFGGSFDLYGRDHDISKLYRKDSLMEIFYAPDRTDTFFNFKINL